MTFKNEGARGFFKGCALPLATTPAVNAIVFSSYEISKVYLGVKAEKDLTFN